MRPRTKPAREREKADVEHGISKVRPGRGVKGVRRVGRPDKLKESKPPKKEKVVPPNHPQRAKIERALAARQR